jgi:hypothetical protein
VLALVVVAAVRVRGGDRPGRVLALAVRGLPAERAAWGRAMLVELDAVRGARERWAFSLGCVRALLVLRIRAGFVARDRGGNALRAAVLGAVAATLALAVYGIVRYPGLRAGAGAWEGGAVLGALALGYAACALTLSRGMTPRAGAARGRGLVGGLVVGAAWLVVLTPPTAFLKTWVVLPLLVAMLVPAGVAIRTGHTGAALWSGLVGGLLVFVSRALATYASDGRPYDPQLIRDFHHSGAHDLATYAVGGSLNTAIGMLAIVPVVALAFGSLGRTLVAR